jgi:alkylated DNA repair dioxygenase AlkB
LSRHAAASLAELPRLRDLLVAAMKVLTEGSTLVADLDRGDYLNVICRCYSPGQSLGLHSDAHDRFEEDVYGCVLENTSDAALQFRHATSGAVFTVEESAGTCFRLCGEARYDWLHGIDPLRKGYRFSVTWRWFRADFLSTLAGG